ncbi:MAG: hypothetical protein HQ485_01600 [Acidobacteria bacterium]|nr:hypothetical protein [Acidobacteriota bacterium]
MRFGRTRHLRPFGGLLLVLVLGASCGPDPESERLRATSRGVYDHETGALTEITFDRDKNGVVDTWTQITAGRPVSSRLDQDEDGVIDRWEEYDDQEKLVRAGWIRAALGPPPDPAASAPPSTATAPPTLEPNTWAYVGPDGTVTRVEYFDIDATGARLMTLREFLENDQLVRIEKDVNGDGRMDKWEVYEGGASQDGRVRPRSRREA